MDINFKFYNPVSSEVLILEHLETEVILTVFVSISFLGSKIFGIE